MTQLKCNKICELNDYTKGNINLSILNKQTMAINRY